MQRVHVRIEYRLQQTVIRPQRSNRLQMPVTLGEILVQSLQFVRRMRFLRSGRILSTIFFKRDNRTPK